MAKRKKVSQKALRLKSRRVYNAKKEEVKERASQWYRENKPRKIAAKLKHSEASRTKNLSRCKHLARVRTGNSYAKNKLAKRISKRQSYHSNPDIKKASARVRYHKNPQKKIRKTRAYYRRFKKQISSSRRDRYALREPSEQILKHKQKQLQNSLYADVTAREGLVAAVLKLHPTASESNSDDIAKVACEHVSYRLISRAIQIRREKTSELRKICNSVKNGESIDCRDDLGKGLHVAYREPYFHDAAYTVASHKRALPINEKGQCVAGELIFLKNKDGSARPMHWKCSEYCKPVTDEELEAIVSVRKTFDENISEVTNMLRNIDNGCSHTHFEPLMGHPLTCHAGVGCFSTLRVLRCASVHFPVVYQLLDAVYRSRAKSSIIEQIDIALLTADHAKLMELTGASTYEKALQVSQEHNAFYSMSTKETSKATSQLTQTGLELSIRLKYASSFSAFQKEIYDTAVHPCICCERLFRRKAVVKASLSNSRISGPLWDQLCSHVREHNPNVEQEQLYLCTYCKPILVKEKMPNRCVLNGLQSVAVPPELQRLNCLEKHLVQRAKFFVCVVRLKAYSLKAPSHNSLKACKGAICYLPMATDKTQETLDAIESESHSLPSPELYIILNSNPTKQRVVYRNLIDVCQIREAFQWLRYNNRFYSNVDDSSLDESTKSVIEVVDQATSDMVEKATENDIAGFQSYTIRDMDSRLSTASDVDEYKMNRIHENALDNRQQHLDVLCFPALFPTGAFGQFHPREQRVAPSDYIKSRLLNKDSRYRKDEQYIFFLYQQLQTRQLCAGIYNMLKVTTSRPLSVSNLISKVDNAEEQTEANLSTMFQNIRGTRQFWWLHNCDVNCMLQEHGPPSIFVTFSCAEYEWADNITYLKEVNGIPLDEKIDIGKLCAEDPVSVTRQFTSRFNAFFQTFILKGKVLGEVVEYFCKREYQARGAPHYHVLLWIKDASVIGVDPPEKVLSWIQERMTCHIPDEKTDPELHKLVTKFQMHRCNDYCKRKVKVKVGETNSFITRCRFGFPRAPTKVAELNPVEKCLKSRNKIYTLPRGEDEVRVNDYNPTMLLAWKANMDIQFVAESSLALAKYVTGYVTKAEKSNLYEMWQSVSDNKSMFSRCFTFGTKCLCQKECGVYEATDMVLGHHLVDKSCEVKYIDTTPQHKRNRRVKNYSELQFLKEHDPNSTDYFMSGLIDTYYPSRPEKLNDMCLYDFVKWIDWSKKDEKADRIYRRLTKPKLPNHKQLNPEREDQRDDYFYSLLILFVPFRDESNLLLPDESAEQAFQRLKNDQSLQHHKKLQKMLEAQSTIRRVNEARDDEEEPKADEDEDSESNEPQMLEGEPKSEVNDVGSLVTPLPDKLDLQSRIDMLNSDQKRIFERLREQLLHERQHEEGVCECDLKPLQMFVSGVGGTGKSFLINVLRDLVADMWPIKKITCAVSAPTGLAAFNVLGVTIFRLLQLPVEHEGKTAGYWSLPKGSQKMMKMNLRHLKLLIIDEISMVSSLNLAYVHLRLHEIFGSDEWFGNKNILFVGDLLQLPPVNGVPIFERLSNKTVSFRLGCAAAVNIWQDTVTYDELTINERQKSDHAFSAMLDSVRRGFPTEDTIAILQGRVIQVSVAEKFIELQQSGTTPVCLFPTRKQCNEFIQQMLQNLPTEVKELPCVDEIDETSSTRKWTKKATEHLEKMNKDCNSTAGLEAKLTLAVGARVMLRRNLNTETGLVNGALGTVVKVSRHVVIIHFDHMTKPYNLERVKSRFMVMKNFYVYRKQFPLILSYAVTIHKCQGLSLDCAIIDLSDKVFSAGMAYVALSRVRSLSGVHLTSFDPASLIVSTGSLKEFNRLRHAFRQDLPLYDIPPPRKRAAKRKLTASVDLSAAKKVLKRATNTMAKKDMQSRKRNRDKDDGDSPPKRKRDACSEKKEEQQTADKDDQDVIVTGSSTLCNQGEWPFSYCPVDRIWQQRACEVLGLGFVKDAPLVSGGAKVELKNPNRLVNVRADGNCLFRAFSLLITGDERHHSQVRAAIVQHMIDNESLIQQSGLLSARYPTVSDYLSNMGMRSNRVWGTDTEMHVLAHLLRTNVFSWSAQYQRWFRYGCDRMDPSLAYSHSDKSMYIHLRANHFMVVASC